MPRTAASIPCLTARPRPLTWSAITAPLLWVQGAQSRTDDHWGGRYSFAEFQARLAHVPRVEQVNLADAGHMLHHDQPEALAAALQAFLD